LLFLRKFFIWNRVGRVFIILLTVGKYLSVNSAPVGNDFVRQDIELLYGKNFVSGYLDSMLVQFVSRQMEISVESTSTEEMHLL